MVIPASKREAVNADILALDPAAGETFRVGLNWSGNPNWSASHYWVGANVTDEMYQAILELMATKYPQAHLELWDVGADRGRPDALLAELNLKRMEVAS